MPTKRKTSTSKQAKQTKPKKPANPNKIRATFHLPTALFEECRDATVFLSGPPDRLTLAGLAATALRKTLDQLKVDRNKGYDFPKRETELKGGRPIGS